MTGAGLISVIIPVFNVEPYLVKALESVIGQTYRDLEIIITDDGSTDGSGLICDDFARRDERIKVIHQENRGLSNARNAGLDIMKGEAVAFLDPDDSYHPDYIKAMAEAMDRTGADIAVCRYTVSYEDGKKHIVKDTVFPPAESRLYGREDALRALAAGTVNVSVWNKIYRSSLWDGIRFPDGHNYEDIYTTYRVFDICRSVFVLDRILYYYLKRKGSITDTVTEENVRDASLARSRFEDYVRSNTPAVYSFEQLTRVRQSAFSGMLASYARYGVKGAGLSDAFLDSFRAEIIRKGEVLGPGAMDIRRKAAYLMILGCPAMLRTAYPVYHAARMMFYKITGR